MPDKMTNQIMHIHLSSWRYLSLLTLPPLMVAFTLLYTPLCAMLLSLFFVSHYFCWRLWLDERLFTLLKDESDLAIFDEGMSKLWPVETSEIRPLAKRWEGARKLLHRAMFTVALLWLFSAGSVLLLSLY